MVRNGRSTLFFARAGVRRSAPRRRHVGEDPDAEAPHHRLKHARPADRAVVHVDRRRTALERQLGLGLGSKRVEQEAQRGSGILSIDAAVLLIGHARAVVDDREQSQCRLAPALLDPQRRALDPFQAGRAMLSKCHSPPERRCSLEAHPPRPTMIESHDPVRIEAQQPVDHRHAWA